MVQFHHALGVVEHEPSLVPVSGGADDLPALLTVYEFMDGVTGSQGGLAVLPRCRIDGDTVPPPPVRAPGVDVTMGLALP
jgi:hypothetical protein